MSLKTAIGFSTKDKPEQVQRVFDHLFDPTSFDLFWFDGSVTPAGERLQEDCTRGHPIMSYSNVRGGPDRAFVVALTTMMEHPNNYQFIGYCEDDVLLEPDWFARTMWLFDRGADDEVIGGVFEVGAVSARAYEDRVLIQRDGYAVMHNLGWGHVIFTREAAQLILQHYRTGWTSENRRTFAQICGRDIAATWAFRAQEQWICSDWGADAVLAQHGLASLALTPSACEMIGQVPPLDQQGLRVVKRSVDVLRDDRVFERYSITLERLRHGELMLSTRPVMFELDVGGYIYFAHQFGMLDGMTWSPDWEMEWNLGFGPFAWRAAEPKLSFSFKVSGPCDIMIGGGNKGGSCRIRDLASGYEVEPDLKPALVGDQMFTSVVVPAGVSYREVVVDRVNPGLVVYGIKTREWQPIDLRWWFDANVLPAVSSQSPITTASLSELEVTGEEA